jgi:hypothetical protein
MCATSNNIAVIACISSPKPGATTATAEARPERHVCSIAPTCVRTVRTLPSATTANLRRPAEIAGSEIAGPSCREDDHDRYPCPEPWPGRGLQPCRRNAHKAEVDDMLIRIRPHDNTAHETQVVETEEITEIVFAASRAYYPAREPMLRRLCGSI